MITADGTALTTVVDCMANASTVLMLI